MKKIKEIFKNLLRLFFYKIIHSFLKKKNYLIVYRYGNAIGDHICLTGVISKIYKDNLKIIVFSNYIDFFLYNPKIYKLFNLKKLFNKFIILKLLDLFEGERIKSYRSKLSDTDKEFFMKFVPKDIHFGLSHAYHFDVKMNDDIFKNEIFFSKIEIQNYEKKFNLPEQFALIHSEAKQSLTSNKNWGINRIQDVVNSINQVKWIQVGVHGEYELKNIHKKYFDLTLRELGFILSKCKFLVSMEGMFNHYASAFEKKNFLVHLGFMRKESIYYPNNVLIHKNSDLKCYPCFLFNCSNHLELCENKLTSEYAVKIIKNELKIN